VKRLGAELIVRNPAAWPNSVDIASTEEPIVKGTIICPSDQGSILQNSNSAENPEIFILKFSAQINIYMRTIL
jgi:translation elongation factor EF-4